MAAITLSADVKAGLAQLQEVVQRDEGRRGISPLIQPGQLEIAAKTLVESIMRAKPCSQERAALGDPTKSPHVVVLTGFPCLVDRMPPCESDGPPGAIAISNALCSLGCRVTLPIEEHSATCLELCLQASCKQSSANRQTPTVLSFPVGKDWDQNAEEKLDFLVDDNLVAVVCIERAGEARDGQCRTQRGIVMDQNVLAPRLNEALVGFRTKVAHNGICLAIGDGGNELGLGAMYQKIVDNISQGASIGCIVSADCAMVSSVSNWGGYALVCALALVSWDSSIGRNEFSAESYLSLYLPSAALARATLLACNDGGALDGISRQAGGSVDGMPLEKQLAVLNELRRITLSLMMKAS